MKTIIGTLLLAALLLVISSVDANAQYTKCYMPKPVWCPYPTSPVCVCDQWQMNCNWGCLAN